MIKNIEDKIFERMKKARGGVAFFASDFAAYGDTKIFILTRISNKFCFVAKVYYFCDGNFRKIWLKVLKIKYLKECKKPEGVWFFSQATLPLTEILKHAIRHWNG
jgi:hypothetical protein